MTTPTDKSEVSPVEALKASCKTESRELPIEEICDLIAAYDSLQNAIFESCGRLPGVSAAEQVKACVDQLRLERDEARVARDFAELACEKAHADGVVIEAACAAFRQSLEDSGCEEVKGVLSNEVGRDLLARYREAVVALEKCVVALRKFKSVRDQILSKTVTTELYDDAIATADTPLAAAKGDL